MNIAHFFNQGMSGALAQIEVTFVEDLRVVNLFAPRPGADLTASFGS
jgi:hypothetical protein